MENYKNNEFINLVNSYLPSQCDNLSSWAKMVLACGLESQNDKEYLNGLYICDMRYFGYIGKWHHLDKIVCPCQALRCLNLDNQEVEKILEDKSLNNLMSAIRAELKCYLEFKNNQVGC